MRSGMKVMRNMIMYSFIFSGTPENQILSPQFLSSKLVVFYVDSSDPVANIVTQFCSKAASLASAISNHVLINAM